MPNRYPLKASLPSGVLPRNIQHVRLGFTRYHLKALQLIVRGVRRFTVNPCSVRENGFLFWPDRLDILKFNMSARRAAAGHLFIFEKDCQNLDAFERLV